MKLVELKCKNCGADLTVEEGTKNVKCQYCQTKFKLDDEVKHIQYDNMEQSGYDFEKGRIRAQQENKNNNSSSKVSYSNNNEKKHGCLFYFLCLMFFPFVITYYVVKSTKIDKKKKIIILTILWLFVLICGIVSSVEEKKLAENPWATECTSISDFEYYLDEEEIILEKYNGSDKRIKVCSTYKIEDKEYKITKFSGALFSSSGIHSVILPDGLITMPNNTLGGSDIKYVYIPYTIKLEKTNYPFYKYFDDIEKIYYSGTKEQWTELTNNAAREDIDAKEIIYEAKISDLK